MMYAFIRWWATVFLRLYFRKTLVYGRHQVPLHGPLILASNHPSAFLEASILTTVMKRPIHFLVRGDMFNPRFQWLFNWTKQIPIYRQKDGISNLRKNASTFELTYQKLGEGEAVLIFPEAKTILEKKMRPIQRGTAHLAFGTAPYIKDGSSLMVQPVGVNFTEPRLPGTDVVIRFGVPFASPLAAREDRESIEAFTEKLSAALSPLVIQLGEGREKNYDVAASVYLRLLHENHPARDAHENLQKIASVINDEQHNSDWIKATDEVRIQLKKQGISEAAFFPDMILLNKAGLMMLVILKSIWLLAGGWLWRLTRSVIFSKIKTNTFQSPTAIGVFMVLMPLITFILTIGFLIAGIPLYFILIWLLVMLAGVFIRVPLKVSARLLIMDPRKIDSIRKSVRWLLHETDKLMGTRSI
jgi:1-acyl-sn-glycerol-3-phosphate acyltransferase